MSSIDITVVVPTLGLHAANIDLVSQCVDKQFGAAGEVLVISGRNEATGYRLKEMPFSGHKRVIIASHLNLAGELRNMAIPKARGVYTFFLDDDDFLDVSSLMLSLAAAKSKAWDIAIFPYRLRTSTEPFRGDSMTPHDMEVWSQLRCASTQRRIREESARLGNYPWIRLINTEFLIKENIIFGKTAVHNDIRFHWHSLVAAECLGIGLEPVCTHFLYGNGSQLTTVRDERRLQVFDALTETFSVISTYPRYSEIRETWISFCQEIIAWAKNNIERKHLSEFKRRATLFRPECSTAHAAATHCRSVKHLLQRIIAR
jgi:glycosyltransferase involved in cell wall biosynthesis